MASKASGANNIVGYQYYMSLMSGICRSSIDDLIEIKAGDLTAWSGDVTDTTEIAIDSPNLFGGDDKEGGIAGRLAVLFGKPDQIVPSWIKDILGGLVPDFRGVTTLFFDGLICSNNPYPKAWKMRVRRNLNGWQDGVVWQPDLCLIALTDLATTLAAQNGAHILYECATNKEWGRGLPVATLDDDHWTAAAQTLFDENFGLCLTWKRTDGLDKFVQVVLNHIGGIIYVSRQTGLLCLDLIRNDYDPDTIPHFDPDSGLLDITENGVSSADTIYNEVVVTYQRVAHNEQAQVRHQSLGSIQSLGQIISTTVDYPGLPSFALASRIAARDVQMQSTGLRKVTVRLDRSGWQLNPGGVFKISHPGRGISNLILRIGKITDSLMGDGSITLDCAQDVFGLPDASYTTPDTPTYTPPSRDAVPVSIRRIEEATYRDLVLYFTTVLDGLPNDASFIKTLAVRPTSMSVDYLVDSQADGDGFVVRGRNAWEAVAQLAANITAYAVSITIKTPIDTINVVPNIPVLIDDEYVKLLSVDFDAGTATIARGCLDTIPAAHSINAYLWFEFAMPAGDAREYVTTDVVDVKMLTRTNSQKLAAADAPTDTITIAGRQGRPYPPGAVTINTTPFASATAVSGDITIAWTHRDRIAQADFIVAHSAGSTGPEPGTTYTIQVLNASNVLIRTVTGLTGTSWVYTHALQFADGPSLQLTFILFSVRDGLNSWQRYNFTVTNQPSGYGFDYGRNYGGA